MIEHRRMDMTKLKRARGSLLRGIRAGLVEAPPGYMSRADYEREDAEKLRAGPKKEVERQETAQ
jgi:hypothetical protein